MLSLPDKKLVISEKAEIYSMRNSVDGRENDKTLFSSACDGKNWRFRFECEEDFFFPRHYKFNEPLYDGDIVELMISLGEKNRYLEVEVNQNNAAYCVFIDNKDGRGDIDIEFLQKNIIISNVNIAINKWICDIILPLDALTELGFDKRNVYFNAHRQDFDSSGALRLYSLSPTYGKTFHNTDAFLHTRFN